MKTVPLTIDGREFRLAFTLDAMADMEDEIDGFDVSKLAEFVRKPRGLRTMVYILARQGELLEGRILDADAAWFGAHILPAPAKIADIQIAVLKALSIGMAMETDEGEQGEKDVVLEEIKKKEPAGA